MNLKELQVIFRDYTPESVARAYGLIIADGQEPNQLTMEKFLRSGSQGGHDFGVRESWKVNFDWEGKK